MERFCGSGKNGKRKCRYCDERARWRKRNKQGWGWYYACHEHKERLSEVGMSSANEARYEARESRTTMADEMTWMRL